MALLLAPALMFAIFLLNKIPVRLAQLQTAYYQQVPQFTSFWQAIIYEIYLIIIAITSYLELIFWPKNLTLYHSEMSFTQAEIILRGIITLALLATIIWGLFKNKKISFWLSWFFIALSPTLTPFGVSWIVAERYAYLASLGIFVLVAMAIEKIGKIVKNPQISYLLLGIIIIPLGIRTIIRNQDWQNQDTLWLATAKTSPSSPQNHNNLGDLYSRHGNFKRAIEEFKTAIKLNPRYADAYHNLGNAYLQLKKVDQAIKSYQKAIEINPNLWQSYQALAAIYFQQKKFELSQKYLKEAVKVAPQNPNLHANLAVVLLKLNQKKEAQKEIRKALRLDPRNPQYQKILQSTF